MRREVMLAICTPAIVSRSAAFLPVGWRNEYEQT